jgi:uncharacterized protein (TIGR03083 family)
VPDISREKARLIGLLDEARACTLAVLDGVDPARCVHPATGWRVKDVVAHILVWEEEALRSLQALRVGPSFYTIPNFVSFDDYNRRAYERRKDVPLDQLLADLRAVRDDAKAILGALPPKCFTDPIPFPWPWAGTLSEMITIMAAHEHGHSSEIARAVPPDGRGTPDDT